jgi:hypothetical protein
VPGPADHRHVAVPVGAVGAHAVARQQAEQPVGGVAVGVVRPDRHQRDRRPARGQEAGVGIGAAVVRHLQHVGGQVDALGHDPRLGLRTQVTGEQHPDAVLGRPHHHAQVVGFCSGRGPRRVGRQHLELGVAHPAALTGRERDVPRPGVAHRPLQPRRPVVGRCQRAGGHGVDLPAGQGSGQPAHVVGVQVREQHERQPPHPQPVQAAGDEGTVGPGVDQDRLARAGREHQRVALTHVAGDHRGVGERPAAAHLTQRPAEGDDPDHRGERHGPQQGPAEQRPRPAGQQQRQQHRTAGTGRPAGRPVRHGGGPFGDRHQPAHRPAGQPGRDIRSVRCHRRQQRRGQAQHRGRSHRRRGHQVGRQRHEADHAGQRGHQRRGDQAGRRAHRQGVGQWSGHPPRTQGPGPARCQQHDGRGGGHRQREARIGGERRLRQQQHHDSGRERRYRSSRAPRRQREHRHPAHHRSPQHAGSGPRQHDESDDRQAGGGGLHPPVGAARPQRPEHQGHDDRHVGARDGSQVRQPGPPEVPGDLRVHRTDVADHEPRQQTGLPVGQGPCRRIGQSGAQPTGRGLEPSGSAHRHRRRPGGQEREHVVAGLGRPHRRPQPHRLTGQQTGPLLGRTEEQRRVAAQRLPGRLDHADRHQHPGSARTAEHPRVVVQRDHDRHHRVTVGELEQRGGGPGVRPDRRDRADERERSQAPDQDGARRAGPPPRPDQQRAGRGGRRGRDPGQRPPGQRGGRQRDRPDGRGRRHQAQIEPGPARRVPVPSRHRARSPGRHLRPAPARRGRRRWPVRCRSRRRAGRRW